MPTRPDVTAVITVDQLGDATTTLTSAAGEAAVVDRGDAWTQLTAMASKAGHPLLVRTIDERGQAYRDVVYPEPSAIPDPDEPGRKTTDAEGSASSAQVQHRKHVIRGEGKNKGSQLSRSKRPFMRSPEEFPTGTAACAGSLAGATPISTESELATEWESVPIDNETETEAHLSSNSAAAVSADDETVPHGKRSAVLAACSMAVVLVCTITATLIDPEKVTHAGDAPERVTESVGDDTVGRPPLGNSSKPAWQLELKPGTVLAVGEPDLVALHARDGDMRLINASTGEVVWQGEAGKGAGSPWLTRIDGSRALAWQRPDQLVVATPSKGHAPVAYETGLRARFSQAGDQILVTEPGRPGSVRVLDGAGLVEVVIRRNATAMAAIDGVVVSSDGSPVLWRTPIHGGASQSVVLRGPDGMVVRRWAGMAGETVTVIWDKRGPVDPTRSVIVAVHDATTGRRMASTQTLWRDVAHARLTSAPGGKPASIALGPAVLPLDGSQPTVDQGIAWTRHANQYVWGTRDDGATVRLDATTGEINVVADASPKPMGVTTSGIALAVIDDTAYALVPEGRTGRISQPPSKSTDERSQPNENR